MFKPARRYLPLVSGLLVALAPPSTAVAAQGPKPADRRVGEALERWKAGDVLVRLDALRRLGRLGDRAAPAVPALIPGLTDPDPEVRSETADVLRRIGPSAKSAVPALVAALEDLSGDVRDAAARALVTTDPDPATVVPALVASLRAGPGRRCPSAAYALASLGEPGIPPLIDLLRGDPPGLAGVASCALRDIGPAARSSVPALIEALRTPEAREVVAGVLAGVGKDAVGPLIRALRDPDPKVRGGAALALERLGPRAVAAVPALIAGLSDPVPPDDPTASREPTFDGWGREGEPRPSGYLAALHAIGAAAVPPLLRQLDAPDRPARLVALRGLGAMGGHARGAVPRLVALLGDPALRDEAATALGGIGPAARSAIPALVAALHEPDGGLRARAAESLGRIGWSRQFAQYSTRTVARGAVAPLADALADPDPRVRAAAARALADIGGEASVIVPRLVAILRDPSADVRLAALQALPRLGDIPRSAIGATVGLLRDPDRRVRLAAARTVRDDDLASGPVIAALLAALADPDVEVRATAAAKLAHTNGSDWIAIERNSLGTGRGSPVALVKVPTAAATLRTALADPDPRVRAGSAYTLPVFRREAGASVPLLAARLKDPDVRVRLAAAVALGQFGPDAAPAVPALLDALGDAEGIRINDFSVASKAAQALRAIGPQAEARMADRLFARLADPDEEVRCRAGEALRNLGSRMTARLVRLLTDPAAPKVARAGALHVLADRHGVGAFPAPEPPAPELRQALPTLQALARDEDAEVRADARGLVAALKPKDEAGPRSLLDAARRDDPHVWNFDQEIQALGPEDAAAMVDGLRDPDEEVRTVAAYALAALAETLPSPEEATEPAEAEAHAKGLRLRARAIAALIAALKDPDTQARWAAAWGLYAFGTVPESVPALVAMARDRTTRVRRGAWLRLASILGGGNGNFCGREAKGDLLRVGAIQALGGAGPAAAPAVPALVEALGDGDGLTRWYAAAVLAEIGPKARDAVPALVGLLRSRDEVPTAPGRMGFGGMTGPPDRLAVVAARALGKIGPDARAAVGPLVEALADPGECLRGEAAEALGGIGPDAASAVPALVRALDDSEGTVDVRAAESLGKVGSSAVPALIGALRGRDPDVRYLAITALGGAGPKAATAIPDLVRALADPDEETRTAAAEALGQIGAGPEAASAVPGLIAALKDADRVVRKSAAEALGQIGPGDDRVIPALSAAMRDGDAEVRSAATDALETAGLPALPALRELLRDPVEDVRDSAALALSRIADPALIRREGETDEQALERTKVAHDLLFAAWKDPDGRIRAGASRALGYLGRGVVPELIAALKDPSPTVRVQASRALGFIGGDAAPALAPLRGRLADPDPEVRRAAGVAIEAIRMPDS